MSIPSLIDFRGGYATDVPYNLMKPNELLKAENCRWKNGLEERKGWTEYNTDDFTGTIVSGFRAFLNEQFINIIAYDDGSEITFRIGESTYAEYVKDANNTANNYTFNTGTEVDFDQQNEYVIATNGENDPIVIYWSSPNYLAMTFNQKDTKTRTSFDWTHGQYETSVYEAPIVLDYEQETTPTSPSSDEIWYDTANELVKEYNGATWDTISTGRYQLATTTDDDGFYVSCDYTFNRVEFSDLTDFTSVTNTPVAIYEYWNGTSWSTITPSTTPTWDGDDTVLEFDLPHDGSSLSWVTYDDSESSLVNQYVLRVTFSTAPDGASFGCESLTIKNTQYFSLVMGWEYPTVVHVHDGRIYFVCGSILYMSMFNAVTGWRADYFEIFGDDGDPIVALATFKQYLIVAKSFSMWALVGDSIQNWQRVKLSDVGTIAPKTLTACNNVLAFLARDGVYVWDGQRSSNVSKHIRSDIEDVLTDHAVGVFFDGYYHMSCPYANLDFYYYPGDATYSEDDEFILSGGGSDSTPADYIDGGDSVGKEIKAVLLFDPDTLRVDEAGERRVSFYKYTNLRIDGFIPCLNQNDTGYLLGHNNEYKAIIWLFRSNTDNEEAVDFRVQTTYFELEGGVARLFGRVKPVVSRAGEYVFIMRSDPEEGESALNYYVTYYQETTPTTPSDGEYWYNPADRTMNQYDGTALVWTTVETDLWGYHYFDAGSGSGYYTEDISVPYTIDGKKISFEVRHLGPGARLEAIHFEEERRRF